MHGLLREAVARIELERTLEVIRRLREMTPDLEVQQAKIQMRHGIVWLEPNDSDVVRQGGTRVFCGNVRFSQPIMGRKVVGVVTR